MNNGYNPAPSMTVSTKSLGFPRAPQPPAPRPMTTPAMPPSPAPTAGTMHTMDMPNPAPAPAAAQFLGTDIVPRGKSGAGMGAGMADARMQQHDMRFEDHMSKLLARLGQRPGLLDRMGGLMSKLQRHGLNGLDGTPAAQPAPTAVPTPAPVQNVPAEVVGTGGAAAAPAAAPAAATPGTSPQDWAISQILRFANGG